MGRLPVTDQPDPTPEEEQASLDRRREEEAQRGPGHEDPERARETDDETASRG